ncbi:MAG: glycosyltransferase family 4 protein [Polaromonas sp.]|nr:glycosyltransferase family 4 protein [Polaromonas sp.]
MRPEGETGVQTHFRTLINYLNKKNIHCELITPYSAPSLQVYPTFGLRIFISLINSEWGVWWYRYWHAHFLLLALKKRLSTGDSCIVYAQCPLSAQAALLARFNRRQRVMMVTHFNISQADEWVGKGLITEGGLLHQSIQTVEAIVIPKLDGLVFVSDFMQKHLVKRIPEILNVSSIVVPNFLQDPGFYDQKEVTADLINIGTLESRKNQTYLLDIVASLRDMGRPLTLTLVGDGPDRRELKNKTRMLKLENLVTFSGYLSKGGDRIGYHRAYIHVSIQESFGITLIEAFARGRPVFAVPVGGIPEILGDQSAGLKLPLNDAKGAAKIVADAMDDLNWMVAAGQAGRLRFLDKYENSIAAHRLIQFLLNPKEIYE